MKIQNVYSPILTYTCTTHKAHTQNFTNTKITVHTVKGKHNFNIININAIANRQNLYTFCGKVYNYSHAVNYQKRC